MSVVGRGIERDDRADHPTGDWSHVANPVHPERAPGPIQSRRERRLRDYLVEVVSPIAACAAASLATGTRKGLHET
jgi:hypothetical protein